YYADRAFLIEMALRGRFREIPEALFFNRLHERSSRMIASAGERAAWGGAPAWISPFDLLHGYLNITRGVLRADVSLDAKMRCLGFAVYKAMAAQIARRKGAHGHRKTKRTSSPIERCLDRRLEGAELGDRTKTTGPQMGS